MKKAKKISKEEIAEDFCFLCKDGGHLMICDYKHCLKSYHPECVGKDDSVLEATEHWRCGWHSCFMCLRSSKFHCYCCPKGVCERCIRVAQFAQVRGYKGFCDHCLKLALLIEEKRDVDSDGDEVDFNDRDTVEFLFKEYWEIIREKEGLNLTNLHSAHSFLEKNQNFKAGANDDESEKDESERSLTESDYDCTDDGEESPPVNRRKRSSDQNFKGWKHVKHNKKVPREFIGWGSRPLRDFLASIGKDTDTKLSQYVVSSIINEYIRENNLFHPQKKKEVVCDSRLLPVLGRRSFNKNRIYDLLETHFAENLEESEDDLGYSSDGKMKNWGASKRQRISNPNIKPQNAKAVLGSPESCFASLVVENVKLVYLKRNLVVQLLKQPDTFEGKIIGSFVRVKSDPNNCMQRNSHQLVQVIGVKKSSNVNEANAEVILLAANMITEIRICTLSDDEFSEEECKDLRRRVQDGLLKRPTLAEFEQKAQSLHEDITKHRIKRELALLQNLIDQANEKGWRRELFEYIERRRLLQTSEEQLRLLREVPNVVAELPELEPASEETHGNVRRGYDDDPPPSVVVANSRTPGNKSGGRGTDASVKGDTVSGGKDDPQPAPSIPEESRRHRQPHAPVPDAVTLLAESHQSSSFSAGIKQNHPMKQQPGSFTVEEDPKASSAVQPIELSDDDDQDDSRSETGEQKAEDADSFVWYCIGPRGNKKGPLSLSVLQRWIDSSTYASKYKVWKVGESEEDAVSLAEAISRTPRGNRSWK